MKPLALPKNQRLCSSKAIDALFSKGQSTIAYPLRAVYHMQPAIPGEPQARFMITVPKKKIRHAVGRVLVRRRIREAYRLNRHLIFPNLEASGKTVDLALVYLSNDIADYHNIEKCMQSILSLIAQKVKES